ncbi:MAG: MFS transporter [Candidatus Bathyarchaeota archaeon]|nr:MFS transporter [Candidatus Bathyarchaeota archaeon]
MSDSKASMIPRNVLVLTLSRVIWSMSDTNIDNFITAFMVALGASVPTIGLINAIGSFGAMLLYPIGGYIADKSGRVRLVSVSTLLYASSFIVYILAPSWRWAAVAMIYQSMVLFYVPAMNAVMADSIPVKRRGKLYAFNFALPNIVRIVAPYIGGLFIARFELIPAMKIGFAISLGVGVLVAAMRFIFLRETLLNIEEINWNPFRLVEESYREIDDSLRWVWDNVRSYTGVSMLLAFLSSMILPFWIIYAIDIIGLTPYEWGIILLWSGVAKAILSLFIGEIVDRYGSRNCFIFGFMLAIPCMYLFTVAQGFWMVLPIYSALVVSATFFWIASQVYLADSIPREIRGRVMAGLGSGMSMGVTGVGFPTGFLIFLPKVLGNIAGGFIYFLSPAAPWLLQSLLLAGGLAYTILMVRDPVNRYE